jgi:hypothetical protein
MQQKSRLKTEDNYLNKVHNVFANSQLLFRKKVCEECSWSTPTFYRKMHLITGENSGRKLSNAEIGQIKRITREIAEAISAEVLRYS